MSTSPVTESVVLNGVPVVAGVAYAPVIRPVERPDLDHAGPAELGESERPTEVARMKDAAAAVAERLRNRAAHATGVASEVLATTASLAQDRAWLADAEKRIVGGSPAEQAVGGAIGKIADALAKAGDLMAERVTDLRDVRDRVLAEQLVLEYARERDLPAVAMCVSTTYGGRDWGRTPHGAIIAGAAFGKLPFVLSGIDLEAVGVNDAASALILAAEKGRTGERYLVSEKMISNAEVARIAAEAAGVPAPTKSIPLPLTYLLATLGTVKGRLRGSDERLSLASLRLMRAEAPVDHGKAVRELGWQPTPVEDSIREAARFWVGLREARRKSAG